MFGRGHEYHVNMLEYSQGETGSMAGDVNHECIVTKEVLGGERLESG